MPAARRNIEMSVARGQLLFELAVLTECRHSDEQEALLWLAAMLDGRQPRQLSRVRQVEATWDDEPTKGT